MIIVECYSDMALVQCLTSSPRSDIIHQIHGRSGVCSQLSTRTNAKGLIDEDPGSGLHPYQKLGSINNDFETPDIKLFKYPTENNILIVLCPKLEDWIIKSASLSHIVITQHGLPNTPSGLHSIIDQRLSELRLVINILKRNKSPRIEALSSLLQ